ncbi:MAG: phage holin family protein [Bacteroidota bacterium]
MENESETYFDETYELFKKYTDDKILLLKIQTAKKASKITSNVIFIFIAAILLFFVVLFLGLMLSYYFAEKLQSNFYGFSIVAGMYLMLLLLFVIIYRSYFSGKIKDMVTGIFFENDPNTIDDDDED